ncbi:lipoprotein signal peptidase [Radiobacillus deserti]|uniref:Lipoprotein signal peptidase n=1 Tax=Radiobacillus deserti TaxID=2594883 RepID=A0A516KL75_9BACI|nr:lipoprotein signal peptidase [Radiobacillus deserti]
MYYYILALVIIGFDQWTKWRIIQTMDIGESIPVLEPFLYITSHRNTGAAWGILEGKMGFFYVVTIVVIAVVIYYMHKYGKESKLAGISLALILGGAIGNFIDRLFRKEVVDFVDVYIGSYDYPIFNVADSSLVVGVIVLLIVTFIDERQKGRTK